MPNRTALNFGTAAIDKYKQAQTFTTDKAQKAKLCLVFSAHTASLNLHTYLAFPCQKLILHTYTHTPNHQIMLNIYKKVCGNGQQHFLQLAYRFLIRQMKKKDSLC